MRRLCHEVFELAPPLPSFTFRIEVYVAQMPAKEGERPVLT